MLTLPAWTHRRPSNREPWGDEFRLIKAGAADCLWVILTISRERLGMAGKITHTADSPRFRVVKPGKSRLALVAFASVGALSAAPIGCGSSNDTDAPHAGLGDASRADDASAATDGPGPREASSDSSSSDAAAAPPSGGPDASELTPVAPSPQYAVNRPPLQPTAFLTLPIGSVRASGWLLQQMQMQAAGLSGHAQDIYVENGPTNQWVGGHGDNWERGPYYVRGITALAYVLGDSTLIANARKWVDWAVASQTANGNFGPASLDPDDWWPRMLMLEAVEDAYDATGDPTLLTFLGNYFRYQAASPTHGSDAWATARMEDDAMSAIYMYNHTPAFASSEFTSLLASLRGDTLDWIGDFNAKSLVGNTSTDYVTHNVNLAMAWKAPAVFWQASGAAGDRASYGAGLGYVLGENSQPEGMPSGDEILHGSGSTEGVETCGVVDSIASHAYGLRVFGDPATGDLIENIAFNALAAATNKTMTGIDYYSIPNEPQAIHGTTKFPEDYSNGVTMSWQSGYPCCRFNWHLGWPRFTQSTWAATPDGGLAALVYAPTAVTAKVAGGQTVSFTESTSYPFAEQIQLTFHGGAAGFPLIVRIPQWATSATIAINGQAEAGPLLAGSLHTLTHRVWNDGDSVVLTFPMPITTTSQVNGSASIHRGPLVYALQIGEKWNETTPNTVDGIDFGEYEVTPTTPWNYALHLDQVNPSSSFKIVSRSMPTNPFVQTTTPVVLQATARLVPGWRLRTDTTLAEEVPASPVQAPGPDVSVTLVPFGAETLRISEFPVLASSETMAAPVKAQAAPASQTTLLELYAPWCAACVAVQRSVIAAAERLGRAVRVVRVNVDEAPEAALRWNVDALPSFLVTLDNRTVAKRVGIASADELVEFVDRARGRHAGKQ